MNLFISTPNRNFNLQLDSAIVAAYTTQLQSLVIKLTNEKSWSKDQLFSCDQLED